jgi:hypothetical protein
MLPMTIEAPTKVIVTVRPRWVRPERDRVEQVGSPGPGEWPPGLASLGEIGLVGALEADTLTVSDFRYYGIVSYPLAGGGRRRALHIIVSAADLGNVRIAIPGRRDSVRVSQARGAAHTSTAALMLDCTRLQLALFGLLPIVFASASPTATDHHPVAERDRHPHRLPAPGDPNTGHPRADRSPRSHPADAVSA